MIIAIAGQDRFGGHVIASGLAMLRARNGQNVLVLDTEPGHEELPPPASSVPSHARIARQLQDQLAQLQPDYHDIVIEADGHGGVAGPAALNAARLVIVPIDPEQVNVERQYALIAHLNSARMFNPGLHVLFVIVTEAQTPSARQMATVREYVACVMSARLAATVIHAKTDHAGLQIAALYREVFPV